MAFAPTSPGGNQMYPRRLALALSLVLPFALGCSSSENLSSKGQLIECQVAADGTTSNCAPVTQPTHAAGTCVDHDNDGDGQPGDADDEQPDQANALDDDGDGITNDVDDDDDNDGIADEDDCDELPGGDSDDGV